MRWLPVLISLATACPALAQTYTIRTFAGGALPENVAGLSASLGTVYGIATAPGGGLYLSLGDYDTVVRMDAVTGMLTRVAGTGVKGFSGDGGPAVNAQLSGPAGLAVDAAGNLYIADSNNSRVRKVSQGAISTIAGDGTEDYGGDNGPATQAQFDGPGALAIDAAGALYIADFYNQVVRKVSNGVVTTVAGNGEYGYNVDGGLAVNAQLAGPSGLAIGAGGSLYIAEGYDNRIRKVSGGIITTVAGNGTAGFAGDAKAATAANLRVPTDVALDTAGNLYIADYGNNRIRAVSAATGVITTFAGNGSTTLSGDHGAATSAGLASPLRIAMDAASSLYIVDGGVVRKVAGGVIATVAGGAAPAGEGGPAASAQLAAPQGLAVDSAGNLFITDSGTGRLLKVTGSTLTRAAGSGVQGFGGDNGPPASAQLSAPSGVAVDLSGIVYIADAQNGRIRKIANGVISTVAGGGTAFGDNGPANRALLSNPQGVAVDFPGNLYLSDLNRIRMVSAGSGWITTAIGNGSAGYQGDGGPATAAYLAGPAGVAVDASGSVYFADYGNNRVRMVTGGIITTVAGNGSYGFSGNNGTATAAMIGAPSGVAVDTAGNLYVTDAFRVLKISKGKVTTIAGIDSPQGIAVDAAGNVYVAEPAAHRVRVLSPAATSCAVTAAPATVQAPSTGGTLTVNVQTGPACPWTVETLPTWAGVLGDAFGNGPGAVTLSVPPNYDAPRSATVVIGGQNVVVNQAGVLAITGQATSSRGAAMPGVTITLSGAQSATAVTDSGGNYSFLGLNSANSYTVTPSLAGYVFVPASQTFSNSTSNPSANFAAWTPPKVGGVGPVFGSTLQAAPASFAPGEIVSLYGTDLCGDPVAANPTLPDRLAACIVQADGVNLRLYYGSAGQINAVLPQSLATGAHQLVAQRYTDTGYKQLAAASQPYAFTVDKASLAFVERTEGFTRLPAAQYPDGGFAGPARPLHAGDTVVLYLTGLGRKAQTFAEGAAPNKTSSATEPIQATVQGLPAQVLYDGVQPQYPGLDQINLKLPSYPAPTGKATATIQIFVPSTGQTVRYEVNSY